MRNYTFYLKPPNFSAHFYSFEQKSFNLSFILTYLLHIYAIKQKSTPIFTDKCATNFKHDKSLDVSHEKPKHKI